MTIAAWSGIVGRSARVKVGVILPLGENPALGRTPSYAEIRALARQVEATGFDTIWLYDHLLYRFPERGAAGVWEGWTVLCALAEATERVALGTLVLCTAFRNPAVLAKMAATLEEVSGGRLILGLGAGWHQPEFDAFGIPFDHRAERFAEALQIIAPLLKEGHVDFQGRYYQAPNCELRPQGPRAGGPPILVAAAGPRMLDLTARYADAWNTAWLGDLTLLPERRARLEAACQRVGRDPRTLEVTVGVTVSFPDRNEAPSEPPDPTKVISGSPEAVAAIFREYDAAGVGQLICATQPNDAATLARLGEALAYYRRMA